MRRELKQQFLNDEIESIDQISCTTIPGCDELNEKLDEKGVEGIFISQKIEKLLTIMNKCHKEIKTKVYNEEKDKILAFESFCVDLIGSFFERRGLKKKSVLPHFFALLLNDLNVSIIFCLINFKEAKQLKKLAKIYFENFVKEQKEEIKNLLLFTNAKSLKKVTLFLSRLNKVLKPLMIKSYLINLEFILLNFAQETIWNNLIKISDISEDEIDDLLLICKEAIELGKESGSSGKGTGSDIRNDIRDQGKDNSKDQDKQISCLLKFKPKLNCFEKILNSSLIEIINLYRQREFKEISDAELAQIIKSIFASSPLRNEFIKELELGDDYGNEEDYF